MFAEISRQLRRSIYQYIGWLIVTVFLITACHNQVLHSPKVSTDCRIVNTILGETCIPTHPQRVIALSLLDNVLALGVQPVGTTTWHSGDFLSFLSAKKSQDITSVGLIYEPNIESILKLKPDLILDVYWGQSHYQQLSQIAPIVAAGDGKNIDWKEWLKTYSEALGKQQEAAALMENYNKRIAEFRQRMGDKISQTHVSLVMYWGGWGYRNYLKLSFGGQILNDIGLTRPPLQNQEKVNEDISLELIPKMAGDVIFLAIGGNEPANIEKLLNHPLWLQLKAVQEGRVYLVDAEAWIYGQSIVAANVVLDDLFKYLINTP
ncbi:iron-siderophore ABC transporter substrate-binding protein [Anabaena subtropica]|uniref:Iron-siderophore ABC transporter substrate-binding protein n=1 Tax=Anabaena subtropica FACHB-260 TaxID=2692884 RepID=A0ABR8CJE4_9NOST|nr:iron-siderophore ABC transporter substrate-binding protein [Anabaena subtropica]MBD2342620.1 iron-siderophore ABC transporter substrate-binding protein [Anabaena subtropica FACHB-260]